MVQLVYVAINSLVCSCRQMRGEELHRLNVEQLQELEKSLESGLGSVHQGTRSNMRLSIGRT